MDTNYVLSEIEGELNRLLKKGSLDHRQKEAYEYLANSVKKVCNTYEELSFALRNAVQTADDTGNSKIPEFLGYLYKQVSQDAEMLESIRRKCIAASE